MKIEDRLSNYMSLLNSDAAIPSSLAKEGAGQAASSADAAVNVELSSTASRMADDEARLIKLNSIRQQLAEGSYNISGKDVADKMLKILKG